MNANVPMLNEIAGKNTKEVIDALNETIRQQQAEIEALHLELDETHKRMILQQAEIEALEASKDRLIKTLLYVRGQQPVAYVNKYADGKELLDNGTDLTAEESTPLYTHPVKELTLTDDEVEEFEWVLKKHFNFPTSEKVPNLDRIIRAILRKAQEK